MADQGRYIAVAHYDSPCFTLLNHTTPGAVSLAATYTLISIGYGVSFMPSAGSEISTQVKSINGLAIASIKSKNGLAIDSIKSINGL